ncbi:MAG: tetratricopeptide repeat protein [Deltaproteobacteria bacterium]|nr:MAG: tetratricopeptide repeat protein [Deltaproteobacteria bacterium]
MDARFRALCLAALVGCAARQKPDLKAAQADLAAGRAELAQHEFEEILSSDPGELAAIRGRIESARRRGALGSLLREAEKSATERSDDAIAWYTFGLAAFAASDEKRAVVALRKAAELRPGEADIQYRLGVALLDGEKFAEARAPLGEAVKLAPAVARYRPPLAVSLGRLGDRKGAIEALREFPRLQPAPEEAALAVKVARSLTDLFRDLPPASRSELEQALGYLSRDAPGLAVPPLEALLARLPDLAPAHALLGLAAARLDEAGRAVTELRRAAELAPDLPQPHAWLAELYAAKDKPETAAAEYALAIERNPLDAESLRRLGLLRLERALPGALDPLQQAAALQPEDDGLQLQLARAEIASGAAVPAKARLERLSQRRPEDAEVLLRLAMLLFDERAKAPDPARGDLTRRVEKLLERVLSLQPENAAANRLLSALRAG